VITPQIFEATHGTAPKHAGLRSDQSRSVILSGVIDLEFMGWQGRPPNLSQQPRAPLSLVGQVTYDLARLDGSHGWSR